MFNHSSIAFVSSRTTLAACLLLVVAISTSSCQATDQASPVTAGPTPSPTEEPDGDGGFGSLVVEADDGIWLLVEDEAPRLLTHGRLPRLSPDGCSVLLIRDSEDPPHFAEYWILGVDDSEPSLLFSPHDLSGGSVYGLAWSPDSGSLAVTTGADVKQYYSGNLWLVDVSDGAATQIAERGAGVPDFSPDGEWIATSTPEIGWSHGSIGLWHAESGRGEMIFGPLMLQYLAWAEDSSGFAAALQRHSRQTETGLELWWVPVDGDPTQLGQLPEASYVSWEPGLERLVYYSPLVVEDPEDHTARSVHSLRLANRDGGGDTVVPDSEGMTLGGSVPELTDSSPWSPNGRWLLTTDEDGRTYVIDTDRLDARLHLNVDRVHGWLDATHYLASTYQLDNTELYRCALPDTCEPLAQFAGEIRVLSYTGEVCTP